MRLLVCALVLALAAGEAAAAEGKYYMAKNDVPVGINADEFKPQTEYASPPIESRGGGDVFLVNKFAGKAPSYLVRGVIAYEGAARDYKEAWLRGGEELEFQLLSHRFESGCRLEGSCLTYSRYQIALTTEQVEKVLLAGGIRAQVSSPEGGEFIVTIPAAYVEAVLEAASMPLPAGYVSQRYEAPTITTPQWVPSDQPWLGRRPGQ